MKEINEFAGRLMTFDKKGEGDTVIEENVLLEITDFTDAAEVEIAFTDRNERCYLKFSLSDLMAFIAAHVGTKG
jgi:hypothetical protein